MKRREFIISSALMLGASTLFTGCTKKEDVKIAGKVARRKFYSTSLPLIALGCMRLPMRSDKIDMLELDKMVDYAMSHGANYFDLAYFYVNNQAEIAMGEILKKYPRESYILADKCPPHLVNSPSDVRKLCEEQLKKCQVDYFDNYMVHNINDGILSNYRDNNMYDEMYKLKKEGKIKNIGFSFHGNAKLLKEVINEHKWDFCMLQLNYLDWENGNAKEFYQIATKAKLPVIVMEPLRGGALCSISENAVKKLNKYAPVDTQASFGLRWVAGRENVVTVLSGMSSFKQMKENINTFVNYREFTKKEEKLASEIAKIVQSELAVSCTLCRYCSELCPKNLPMFIIFDIYNLYKASKAPNRDLMFKYDYSSLDESARGDKCIECGQCKKICPQGLDIPKLLKKIDEEFKNLK